MALNAGDAYNSLIRKHMLDIISELLEDEDCRLAVAEDLYRKTSLKWLHLFWGLGDQETLVKSMRCANALNIALDILKYKLPSESSLVLANLALPYLNEDEFRKSLIRLLCRIPYKSQSFEAVAQEALEKIQVSSISWAFLPNMLSMLSHAAQSLVDEAEKLKQLDYLLNIVKELSTLQMNEILKQENLEQLLRMFTRAVKKEAETSPQSYIIHSTNLLLKLHYEFRKENNFLSTLEKNCDAYVRVFDKTKISNVKMAAIDRIVELVGYISVQSIFIEKLATLDTFSTLIHCLSNESTFEIMELYISVIMEVISKKLGEKEKLSIEKIVKFVTFLVDYCYESKQMTLSRSVFDFLILLNEIILEDRIEFEHTFKKEHGASSLLKQLNRITILILTIIDINSGITDCREVFDRVTYHSRIFFGILNSDSDYLKCMAFLSYKFLNISELQSISIEIWLLLLSKRPLFFNTIFKIPSKKLNEGFSKLLQNETLAEFLDWLLANEREIKNEFSEFERHLEIFIQNETKNSKDCVKSRNKKCKTANRSILKRSAYESSVMLRFAENAKKWNLDVREMEKIKLQRFKKEYEVIQSTLEAEWKQITLQMNNERNIFGNHRSMKMTLDFTEGTSRMRKKFKIKKMEALQYASKQERILENNTKLLKKESLARLNSLTDESKIDKTENQIQLRKVESEPELESTSEDSEDDGDSFSFIPEDGKPQIEPETDWTELYLSDDQNRNILRLLAPGDDIVEVFNSGRLLGLDLCEGVSIICETNFYMVDNYFNTAEGVIVDVDQVESAQKNIYHSILKSSNAKTKAPISQEDRHMCRRCSYVDIREVHKRLHLFRDVGLEMFLVDGRNFFLTFWTAKDRDSVYNRLLSRMADDSSPILTLTGNTISAKISEMTNKWCIREISTFSYLMYLNTIAGRSYNDLTQYPVFPWIIADYTSEALDLSDPKSFRDLSKPMGGQGEKRAKEFNERFLSWDETSIPACHYGTHYSSSMIVCSFLIRIEPFVQDYLNLQGGCFDHTDRLFHSIPTSYISASKLNTTDVRELIPEFYYLPDFLTNLNSVDFGEKQTGERIDSVILPAWAKSDPRLFIKIHREALESEYVSSNINHWIDLIFGFKQTGDEAAKNLNVFHYLSYEGAVGSLFLYRY